MQSFLLDDCGVNLGAVDEEAQLKVLAYPVFNPQHPINEVC